MWNEGMQRCQGNKCQLNLLTTEPTDNTRKGNIGVRGEDFPGDLKTRNVSWY